jgi:hypothetical protein
MAASLDLELGMEHVFVLYLILVLVLVLGVSVLVLVLDSMGLKLFLAVLLLVRVPKLDLAQVFRARHGSSSARHGARHGSRLVLVFLVVLGRVMVTRYGAPSDHPPTPKV